MTSLKNLGNSLPVITGFLTLFLILALNFNTFYWADDYAILNEINKLGIFQRCVHGYYAWDGRYMTTAAFLQGAFLELLPVEMITLFWNGCFLLSGIILSFIIKEETKSKFAGPNKLYLPILIAIAFWLGSYSHISQTIYWATGGVYSFNLLLGAVWLYCFYKIQRSNVLTARISFIFFTIFIGITTQNLTIGLITLLLLTILYDFLRKEKSNIRFNALLLLIIIGGTVFLSAAPGNFVRIKEINNNAAIEGVTLWIIIKNSLFALATYLKLSFFLILLAISSGFVYICQSSNKVSATIRNIIFIPKTKEQLIAFIDTYKYLIVALSTILPFITMPEVVSPRTAIYFMFFFFLFVVKFISDFSVIHANSKENYFSNSIVYAVYFTAFCFIAYNFNKGIILKTEIAKRESLLKNSKNKVVLIRKIDENLKSHCYDFRDFRSNDDWAVEAQKEYFGIQNIIIE
ncbi:hypothetical protein FEDK69T_03060 [Flavobacterium enshiense DK69]|uniref:Glycosyltransferase RgtA/B/C/D-like domain-containing protein n=1 Tax=Flavobacterium enshiense DK69 TaxID=1107311 RepID=V6SE66_9FLAO|nr:DUF6056 family protein [Flavobacterium enshiense]ESU24754.1 hypothetical protein FEDK69T_03060 [Flavobacterium enshiense DK69]KGO96791.1 hypothetical protein Q767_03540 [Flavobacterium enshiense DK69]